MSVPEWSKERTTSLHYQETRCHCPSTSITSFQDVKRLRHVEWTCMAKMQLMASMATAKLEEMNVKDTDPAYKAWLLDVKNMQMNSSLHWFSFNKPEISLMNAVVNFKMILKKGPKPPTKNCWRRMYALLQNYDSTLRNNGNNNDWNSNRKQWNQGDDKGNNNNSPDHSFQQQDFR